MKLIIAKELALYGVKSPAIQLTDYKTVAPRFASCTLNAERGLTKHLIRIDDVDWTKDKVRERCAKRPSDAPTETTVCDRLVQTFFGDRAIGSK